MNEHRHEPYEIWGTAATSGETERLRSETAGLRQDLAVAEGRISDLSREISVLAEQFRELRADISGAITAGTR